MFAYLVNNSVVSETATNARLYDILLLATGGITQTSQLNATYWDMNQCYISVAVSTGNWSAPYSTISPLVNIKTSASTSWHTHLTKPSASFGTTKPVSFRLARSSTNISILAGKFNADGSSQYVTTAAVLTTTAIFGAAYQAHMISCGPSSFVYSLKGNGTSDVVAYAIERTACPYDETSNECLVIVGQVTAGSTAVNYIGNIYNPKLNNYTAYTPNFFTSSAAAIRVSRDAMGVTALPLVPMYTEKYENGWGGGSMSQYSGLYLTCQSFYAEMDLFTIDNVNYRILSCGSTGRMAVVDG